MHPQYLQSPANPGCLDKTLHNRQLTIMAFNGLQFHNYVVYTDCRRTWVLPRFFLSFFLSFFFIFRYLPSELAERNSTEIGHMLGSKCDLKMRVRNLGYT